MEGELPLCDWINLAESLSSQERAAEILQCVPDDRNELATHAYVIASFVAEAVHDGIDELMTGIDGAEAETHVPRMQIKTRFVTRNDARVMELLRGHLGDQFQYFAITDRQDGVGHARMTYAKIYDELVLEGLVPDVSEEKDPMLCDHLADASVLAKEARALAELQCFRSSPSFLRLTERTFSVQDIAEHAERMLISLAPKVEGDTL